MKRAVALLAVTAACTPAFTINILENPGFESGELDPWFNDQNFGGSDWTVDNLDPHSGTYSATNVGNVEIRQNFAPTLVSDITEVSFWMKHPLDNGVPSFVTLFYSDNTDTGFVIFTYTEDWTSFNVTGNLEAGKSLVGIGFFGHAGGGKAEDRTRIDDAVIDAVPEPSSILVLVVAASALITRRRRR